MQHLGEELVLAIAQATDRLGFWAVAWIALGQLQAPRLKERTPSYRSFPSM
jgi:hypothetical protein